MATSISLLLLLLVFGCIPGLGLGSVLFSTLPQTLAVSASPQPGQVLVAGEDKIKVSWSLNQSLMAGADDHYKKVRVKLCYTPISQVDRAWRKTNDELSKDKTCQFDVTVQQYTVEARRKAQSFDYVVQKDVPTATYFIRAYVLDSSGKQVAYGQTTDAKKSANLFEIEGISGRHTSIDVAAACFSAFSVISLVGFFIAEKRKRQ